MFVKMIFPVGIGMAVWACHPAAEEKAPVVEFPVSTLYIADTLVNRNYVGQIRSINHIELRAQEKGYLQKIYVDEGQRVKQGQILFKIMPNLYEAEVKKAEAEVEFASIELQNTKALTDNQVVAPNELAMAKAKFNKAKAEWDLMKTHLDLTVVRAPFDGLLNRFHVRLGSLIEEGELLTELSDNRKMWVYFNVPEAEYLSYMKKEAKGDLQKVHLQMANGERFDQTGTVETIEADFDHETGNIPFRATFPNPNSLLRHGQTGNVVVTTFLSGAMMIPQKATFEVLEKKYVFVVNKAGQVHTPEVEIAAELPHIYVLKSGLAPHERILLEGIRLVKEMEKIKVKNLDPKVVIHSLDLATQ
jgi:membrane fusion protein (multidrug efflux system)